jgi:hypothetical protein
VKWGDLNFGSSNGSIDISLGRLSGIEANLKLLTAIPRRLLLRCRNWSGISCSNWKNILMLRLVPPPLNGNSKSWELPLPPIAQLIAFQKEKD